MKKVLLLMAVALPFVLISCGDDKDEPVAPDGHGWVDLGLPSGTLWATCNVGATSPEEYGDYFAWGETAPKEDYSWNTYKWCNSSEFSLTKYNTSSDYGPIDNKKQLDLEDDAAQVNWGASWRMPSLEQIQELCESCFWQWTQRNGVNGQLVTGPNGKTLFLPAAGGRGSDGLYNTDKCGYYWSRTLYSSDRLILESAGPSHAYIQFFHSWEYEAWYDSRSVGYPVRAVRVSKK